MSTDGVFFSLICNWIAPLQNLKHQSSYRRAWKSKDGSKLEPLQKQTLNFKSFLHFRPLHQLVILDQMSQWNNYLWIVFYENLIEVD